MPYYCETSCYVPSQRLIYDDDGIYTEVVQDEDCTETDTQQGSTRTLWYIYIYIYLI